MKKSLVLAMAMALGVTASAYAANPFSDVPAGHWAYDSIDKLAAAGVIDGMGDGTFQGSRNMTRYEMAQIVAKAMAKGANVDKLAAEFAEELDNLGVRVAALEKKADNVKITGRVRFQAKGIHGKGTHGHEEGTNNWSRLRSDITIKGQVNEDWSYTALFRNEERLDKGNKNVGEEDNKFQRAYVEGKLGGLKVTAGRYNEVLADGLIYDDLATGVVASYGKDIKLTAGYATLDSGVLEGLGRNGKLSYGVVDAKLGKAADLSVGYYGLENNVDIKGERKLFSAALGLNLGKSAKVKYTYIKADEEDIFDGDRGHVIALTYKGADKAKVGSWGMDVIHYDQDLASYVSGAHTMDAALPTWDYSFKGWKVGADYTIAKNIVLGAAWYDLKDKVYGGHTGTLFGDLSFYF